MDRVPFADRQDIRSPMNSCQATGADESLISVLERRASDDPSSVALTFLDDGELTESTLTYGQLAGKARAVARELEQRGAVAGDRALLLYAPGLDYIAALLGCFYARVIAVPAYPPDPNRLDRTLPRLTAIIADSGARLALTTAPLVAMAEFLFGQAPPLRQLQWIATDVLPETPPNAEAKPIPADTIAFLQYTSGSTGSPKGVKLTHGNLLHNLEHIRRRFGHSHDSKGVIWLPPYHDMGLIGGVLQPLYVGFPVVLFSPVDFLRRPLRWLQAVSKYRATTSGGPNFAYELCVRKVTDDEAAALDLSAWEVAFNGAEPIRPGTLERFARKFAPSGFRREAFYPCYGLAEATLLVTGGRKGYSPTLQTLNPEALELNQIRFCFPDANTRTLVSSGRPMDDQEIEIVHPQELRRCGPNEVGEIWVKGQSVSPGYWNRAEETVHAFEARFDGGVGNYLRTGDLGFLRQGELFVTGRLKDLIIIRGRNHYPQDIERTAEESYPTTLRKGCVAAFSIEAAGQERLALAVEVDQQSGFDAHELSAAIREAIADLHGLQVYTIAFLPAGALPKTSSGKLQRQAIRSGFLDRTLQEIGREELKLQSIPAPGRASQRPSAAPTSKDSTEGMLELHGPVRLDEGRN